MYYWYDIFALQEGAQTSIEVSVSESCEQISGEYFSDCRVAKCSATAQDADLAKGLWDKSTDLVELYQHLSPEFII